MTYVCLTNNNTCSALEASSWREECISCSKDEAQQLLENFRPCWSWLVHCCQLCPVCFSVEPSKGFPQLAPADATVQASFVQDGRHSAPKQIWGQMSTEIACRLSLGGCVLRGPLCHSEIDKHTERDFKWCAHAYRNLSFGRSWHVSTRTASLRRKAAY